MATSIKLCAGISALVIGTICAPGAASAAAAKVSTQVLPTIAGPVTGRTGVNGLGKTGVAVGDSNGLPVYWTGTTLHRVPLPPGATDGAVSGVNQNGLMAGSLDYSNGTTAAFSYQSGAKAVTILPDGQYAAGVNSSGLIAGEGTVNGSATGIVWSGKKIARTLQPGEDQSSIPVTGINDAGQVIGDYEGYNDTYGEDVTSPVVWSATPGAAPVELDPESDSLENAATGIDSSGRVVGWEFDNHSDTHEPDEWIKPYGSGDQESRSISVPGRDYSIFNAISKQKDLVAGTLIDSQDDTPPQGAQPDQAYVLYPGRSVIVLPRLAAGGASASAAVTDDGRVGGSAVDGHGTTRPVVWTTS